MIGHALAFAPRLAGRIVWDRWIAIGFAVGSAYQGVAAAARRRSGRRDREWTMATVNLAGCVLFAISAVASYIVPSSGSILDLAAANWTTGLGALCFLAGALMLLRQSSPRRYDHAVR